MSAHIPTRSVSEGAALAPQMACGIPRSRFGLVLPFPFEPVVFNEKCRFFRFVGSVGASKLNGGEETRLLTELHRDSLDPMMGKDAWVAGADRGEAPGPTPVRLGPTPQVGFPPLRLRRQPPGSLQLWNGGVQRGVSTATRTS